MELLNALARRMQGVVLTLFPPLVSCGTPPSGGTIMRVNPDPPHRSANMRLSKMCTWR